MNWKNEARQFFSHRAKVVGERPTLQDLCYVSGRDSRVWADQSRYDDMMDSIVRTIGADASSRVLEVGCAAGFIACGVAPKVGQYVGVDVAEGAIECARSLDLPNATFHVGDGGALPFDDSMFDGVYCYDVLTNFPTFDSVKGLVQDMVRVVRPGGKVLLGIFELQRARSGRDGDIEGARYVRLRSCRLPRPPYRDCGRRFARWSVVEPKLRFPPNPFRQRLLLRATKAE